MSGVGVQYRLIGEVNLTIDGEIHGLAGRRQRELLALLLLEGKSPLSADRIAYELWGDSQPKTARNSVQRFVADVRGKLGPYASRLSTETTGYYLDFDRTECDLFRGEDLIEAARQTANSGQFVAAARMYSDLGDLQRGIPFAGTGDVEFAERARRRTDELWHTANEDHFEVALALGRHVESLTEIAAFAVANPYRERAWEHYLIALYRCGRQQDALHMFEQVQATLITELGVSPSPTLIEIRQQILHHAPDLQAPALVPLNQPHTPNRVRSGNLKVPQYLVRSSEIPLAGRSTETEAIGAALSAAATGKSQTIVVRGEPGIGKTRLAAAAAVEAVEAGFTVVYGRSDESLAIAYQAWIEALTSLASSVPSHALRSHQEQFGMRLAPLIHNLAYLISPNGRTAVSPAEQPESNEESPPLNDDQMAFSQAVLGLIQVAIEEGPLLVILDDLQWADPSTLQLLAHVVQRAGGQLAMLLVYRSTGLDTDSPLVGLVGRLSPLPSVTEIDLDGLQVDDLAQVIEDLGGGANNESLAHTVRVQTNGNAFFATEVIRHIISNETTIGDSHASVPASTHLIIQRRVAKLGQEAAITLHAASVFGRYFELDLLASVIEADEFAVLDSVERALSDGLLVDSEQGYDRFQFAHDLVQQSLYDELSRSRRSRLHLRAADAIEKFRPRDHAARSGEIASHLLAVGDRRIAMRCCLAARDAGQAAAAAFAPGEAVRWFTRALEQLDMTVDDPSLRARLLVQLGISQQHSRTQNHRETLLLAGSIAHQTGDTDALVASCLANTRGTFANVWDVDHEAVTLLLHALEAIDDSEVASRASLLASLASEQWDLDHGSVIERHMASIALARESGRPEVLANALLRYARARGCYLSMGDHRAINAEISTLFDDHKMWAPTLFMTLHQSKLQVALQSADADAVRQAIAGIRSLPEVVPLPYVENVVVLLGTIEVGLSGDPEKYEAAAAALLEYNLDRGDTEAFFIYEAHLLYARLMQGRTSELIGDIERIIAERPEAELYQSVAALLHAEAGDLASSANLLAVAHERGFVEGKNVFVVQSLGFWGEVAAGVGNHAAAQELYDMLEPFNGQFLGNMTQLTQPVDLTLGRLCTTLGRFEDATRFLARSAVTAEQFEAPWMTARTALHQGVLAAADGSSPEVVQHFASQALEIARKGCYRAIIRDAKAILARFQPRP